jgi:hypothetical protein
MPISRMILIEALRRFWYSRSVSVCARVHAHRVDVLDRADDDDVVGDVAHHLHLELLPAVQVLVDLHLGVHGQRQPAPDDLLELLDVVGDAAARPAHGERRPDHARQADLGQHAARVLERVRDAAARQREPAVRHRGAEQVAVLGLADDLGARADHLDAEALQHARVVQRERGVQRGLPTEGGEQRVGPLLLDDLRHDVGRDRLDVRDIGRVRVGHDRGRVRVDQHDLVALLAQRLAGLRAGIVELAGLPDDDRAAADDQDGVEVVPAGHRGAGRASAVAH